jgi:amidase
MKTIVDAEPWLSDPKCVEIPWREDVSVQGRKLSIGVIKWDTLVMPHPPVQRGVQMVVEALTAQGHDIFEWSVPDPAEHDRLTVPTYKDNLI